MPLRVNNQSFRLSYGLRPYFGTALQSSGSNPINQALVQALQFRGPYDSRLNTSFTLTSGSGECMYYAYPASYGTAIFTDLSNNFQGGWDGALGDPTNPALYGPATVMLTIAGQPIPFYVYETDYPNLGTVTWSVT